MRWSRFVTMHRYPTKQMPKNLNSFSPEQLVDTTGTSSYNIAEDNSSGPEIQWPLSEWSSWCGSESSRMEIKPLMPIVPFCEHCYILDKFYIRMKLNENCINKLLEVLSNRMNHFWHWNWNWGTNWLMSTFGATHTVHARNDDDDDWYNKQNYWPGGRDSAQRGSDAG